MQLFQLHVAFLFGNGRADRLVGKAAVTSGLRLGRCEVMRNLGHFLRTQSRGQRIIGRQEEKINVRKEKALDSRP